MPSSLPNLLEESSLTNFLYIDKYMIFGLPAPLLYLKKSRFVNLLMHLSQALRKIPASLLFSYLHDLCFFSETVLPVPSRLFQQSFSASGQDPGQPEPDRVLHVTRSTGKGRAGLHQHGTMSAEML